MTIPVRPWATAALGVLALGLTVISAFADEATLELGKRVFLEVSEPRCGVCHTLADAGTTGEVGPILDELKPDAARVRAAVVNGIGPMPANEILTNEQVEAVGLYVSTVANQTK
ncbi:cytochrome c [Mesorhizobium tianshanense]|uniref:Cbb3-type cytochrome c oxidase subunit III n=1 Tax=Mesorhizobium tianshanense TaxID=39844 RepID=A0A562MH79_9HYPH|nr:cytochrome c [Mesorhizobium tianshanense]TWI19246.1 cbb3-type cytochrome c oxidase subunit III [Mesorhizobium tianshanense]GLS41494.1 cytochrome c [Mesorhizobium tianshanense]